jgi:hypothetical protein
MTFRLDSGLQLRFFGGVDRVLTKENSRTTPVGGIGVGYAF